MHDCFRGADDINRKVENKVKKIVFLTITQTSESNIFVVEGTRDVDRNRILLFTRSSQYSLYRMLSSVAVRCASSTSTLHSRNLSMNHQLNIKILKTRQTKQGLLYYQLREFIQLVNETHLRQALVIDHS